jgi:hypothetical protein
MQWISNSNYLRTLKFDFFFFFRKVQVCNNFSPSGGSNWPSWSLTTQWIRMYYSKTKPPQKIFSLHFFSSDWNDWKCSIKSKELSTLSVERWDNITNPCRQNEWCNKVLSKYSLSTCSHVTSNDTWFYLSNKGSLKLSKIEQSRVN